MARYDDGQVLYFQGAVEVVEERLREPANDYGAPSVASGVYSVRGSRGRYTVTCEAPVLGVPDVVCDCEDYRRRGTTCKHGYAVMRHVAMSNRRISLERQIERAREALENGGGGLRPEFHLRSVERATRELAELGPGERRAAEAAAVVAERDEPARRRGYEPPAPITDDTELPL